jgi:hypothetical protein
MIVAVTILIDAAISTCGAASLDAWSSPELHRRCLAYQESPQSQEGRSCGDYIRGFIEGSPCR